MAEPWSPAKAGQEIRATPSESVEVSLSKEGKVKFIFPEYKISPANAQRSKVVISNSFRVPLTKAEIHAFNATVIQQELLAAKCGSPRTTSLVAENYSTLLSPRP